MCGVFSCVVGRTSFFGLLLEGLVGLHRIIQLQLLQHYCQGIDLDYFLFFFFSFPEFHYLHFSSVQLFSLKISTSKKNPRFLLYVVLQIDYNAPEEIKILAFWHCFKLLLLFIHCYTGFFSVVLLY